MGGADQSELCLKGISHQKYVALKRNLKENLKPLWDAPPHTVVLYMKGGGDSLIDAH